MVARVILMCAGRAERWGSHLGVHKHLILINGEPLLDRTLRLIRANSSASVVIVAFDPQYGREGCEPFEPEHGPANFCDTDKFLSAESRWAGQGQTVILYGDVFFTEAAMRTILSHEGPYQFFGRREWSYYTGRPWRELFALSFAAEDRECLREAMLSVRSALLEGATKTGGGWDLYHHLHGRGWDRFASIDDFTDDFDFPSDYDQWIRRYRSRLHRMMVPLYSRQLKQWHWRIRAWRRKLHSLRTRQP